MGTTYGENIYYWVGMYIEQLPLWRRILAKYFKKYKVTQEEYLEWLFMKK